MAPLTVTSASSRGSAALPSMILGRLMVVPTRSSTPPRAKNSRPSSVESSSWEEMGPTAATSGNASMAATTSGKTGSLMPGVPRLKSSAHAPSR